ncbi:hypothetical protein OF83DRAFT_408031 [Amylostereum chailletii]|nr:hypothetical protein OF83DRAFT_408031 [Amylostereum chailletii]
MFTLKAFWLFTFAFTFCLAQNMTAPPACATACATVVATDVQCGSISNTTCICNTNVQQFATLGGECIGSQCSSTDLDAARTYFEGLCPSPSGSSSASASGSSGLTTILPGSTTASAPASNQTGNGGLSARGAVTETLLMWGQFGVLLAACGVFV